MDVWDQCAVQSKSIIYMYIQDVGLCLQPGANGTRSECRVRILSLGRTGNRVVWYNIV